MIIEDTESFENVFVSNYWYDADGERTVKTSGENEAIYVNPYLVAGQGGEYTKHIYIAALGESLFPSSLAFPRRAKVIFRVVWHFCAWRKSFPEWFGISAHGESRFPSGLAFPRSAKIFSRMVWSFRAWRKSFHESLDNLTPKDVYLGRGEKIKKIREIIKQKSINKRIFDNKTMKYQSK